MRASDSSSANNNFKVKAFVRNESVAEELEGILRSELGDSIVEAGALVVTPYFSPENPRMRFGIWQCSLRGDTAESKIESAVDNANLFLLSNGTINGRVFSTGKHVNIYKEVGYPQEVAKMSGLDVEREVADLWIAHTRQPTNSPGAFPIWSHPFASGECAIIHNGDISSFGATWSS